MQIVAVTDPLTIGFKRQAMVGHHGRRATSRPWPTSSARFDEVDYVVVTAGSFDIIVELVCEDDDELLDLLNHCIRSIPEVRTHRDVHLPEAGEADLRVGDPMTDPEAPPASRRPPRRPHDHLWMHFTRMSSYDDHPVPVIVRGEGAVPLRPARHADPRRPVRASSSCRPATAARSWPRPRTTRPATSPSSRCGRSPTRRPPSSPSASASLGARRPRPRVLHHRRRRGGRVGVEDRPPVLQAHRPARQDQGHQPLHRLPRHDHGGALDHRHPGGQGRRSSRSCPGAIKVPNTNFYRAPEHGDDLEAFGRWAADQIEAAIEMEGPDTVAAVFLEPVQNSGGCFPPPPGYFQRVRENLRPPRRAARVRRGDLRVRPARPHVRLRPLRLPARHDHLRQGHDVGLLADRRHDRVRADHGAVPARRHDARPRLHLRRPPGVGRGGAGQPRPVRRARTCSATSCATRTPSGPTLEKLHDLPDRRRRPRRRVLLRDRAREGQGHQGDASTTTSPSGSCAASSPAALFDSGLHCRADDRGDPVIQLAPPLICDQAHFDEIEQILRTTLTEAWRHL